MPFDPDVQIILDMIRLAGRPSFEELTPDEARQAYNASRAVLAPVPQPVAEARDMSCPGPHGDIPLRYYRPEGSEPAQVLPALMYFRTTPRAGTSPMRPAAW
jgi:acetyl esterase